jgi:5-(carboxyamino)imidazole ribonucleotide mutase
MHGPGGTIRDSSLPPRAGSSAVANSASSQSRPSAGPVPGGGSPAPRVGIVMGSRSDWATLERAAETLGQFGVPHECEIVSAHRTPDKLAAYSRAAAGRGLRVIIAGAGGAAHLPGMVAAQTHLPVLGVPVESSMLRGVDSLLSIVQMPAGIPVGTLAIGPAGAVNAALLAVSILAIEDAGLRDRLVAYRTAQTERVLAERLEAGRLETEGPAWADRRDAR